MAGNYLVRNRDFPEGVIARDVDLIRYVNETGGMKFIKGSDSVVAFFSKPCSYCVLLEDDSEEVDA